MKRALPACVALAMLALFSVQAPAGADPTKGGSGSAYGAKIDITDQNVITEPAVASSLADDDASATTVDVPASPLAVSGTLIATAAVHPEGDLTSGLLVNQQGAAGPYNAVAFGGIEGAQVLVDAVGEGVSLLRADAIRAEAVAVCSGTTVTYSAQSEIVNLDIGGEDVPLNGPVEQIIDAINEVLTQSGLNQVVNVERNVVTQDASGVAVDALRVTVLAAAGDTPLGTVVLGHAEVKGATCGPHPQCSDGVDNADPEDTLADIDDPGCHTDGDPKNPDTYDPNDDDETDGAKPECSDGVDNADPEDTLADIDDPGCHTDGDATNAGSYDPNDDDETDVAAPQVGLPRTGGDSALATAMVIAIAGLARSPPPAVA